MQIGWDGTIGGCASCSDGEAEVECDGCYALVCRSCWAEHNEDPDEVISKEQFILLFRIWPEFPADPRDVLPAWRNN